MGKRVAKPAAVPEPSSHKCCSKRRRVGSARARKTRCECSSVITCFFSPLGEMLFRITSNTQYKRTRTAQALHDFLALEVSTQPVQALLPAILVVAIGFLCWNRLRQGSKPRLNQRQEGPFSPFFQGHFHQRTGCGGKRELGMTKSIGRPAKGKTMRLLNHLDHARVGARLIFPGKMDAPPTRKSMSLTTPNQWARCSGFVMA